MPEAAKFLNLNGLPSDISPGDGQLCFIRSPLEGWILNMDDHAEITENLCILIHDEFERAIMQEIPYREIVYSLPIFISEGGHNSECALSRDDFEKLIGKLNNNNITNRFLYMYDCQKIISSIQECNYEVTQIIGEFYNTLNSEFSTKHFQKNNDGVRTFRTPETMKMFSYLNFIFIRMHSLLDYIVKLVIESEKLKTDFSTYPRTASRNKKFSDRKEISSNRKKDTLLEDCILVKMLESLRNYLIHDGLLDEMPKVYERSKNGFVVERFILFPDMTDGNLDRFKNRSLFYGKERKINLSLPFYWIGFRKRQAMTLALVLETLHTKTQK